MSFADCTSCKEAGTTPLEGLRLRVVYDPTIQVPGSPTIEDRRISAEAVANRAWESGIEGACYNWDLGREEVIVACWWAGLFGPSRLRNLYRAWAEIAGAHLWYGCIQVPDPPTA